MTINKYIATSIIFFCFFIFPVLMLVLFSRKKKILKISGIIFFCIYILFLFLLVFGKLKLIGNNFVLTFPTNEKWFDINFTFFNFGQINLFYNLIMMFPVSAFIISQTNTKTFIKTVVTCFLLSLFIEIMQFVLPISRTTEIADLFLNTLSGIVGFFYYNFFIKILKRKEKR